MNYVYFPRKLSHYHECLVIVMFKSPNGFTSFDDSPVDQSAALREAFEMLQEAFPVVEKKLKDNYLASILRELLKMAYEFYVVEDVRNGSIALQEVKAAFGQAGKSHQGM